MLDVVVSVLPKFEVSVIHPEPVYGDASTVSWKVCAQYVNSHFKTYQTSANY